MKIRTHNNEYISPVIGDMYSAIGVCGMTDGIEVIGTLIKIDWTGAYLENNRVPHLCNQRTLIKL